MFNTLYLPVYAKHYVSQRGIVLNDPKATAIWQKAYPLLETYHMPPVLCYYLAMKTRVFDAWVMKMAKKNPTSVVLNIGCGLDDRAGRVKQKTRLWYDIDLPDIILERKEYYHDTSTYHMISYDPSNTIWLKKITGLYAIVVIEDAAMYMKKENLLIMLSNIKERFTNVKVLINVTTEMGQKVTYMKEIERDSRGKRKLKIEDPEELCKETHLHFVRELNLTPKFLVNQIPILERVMFMEFLNSQFSRKLYRLYEYRA